MQLALRMPSNIAPSHVRGLGVGDVGAGSEALRAVGPGCAANSHECGKKIALWGLNESRIFLLGFGFNVNVVYHAVWVGERVAKCLLQFRCRRTGPRTGSSLVAQP